MKKLTLLSITLLTTGNALAMDVAPYTPRTAHIVGALKKYNHPAHEEVVKSVPGAPSIEEQVKILCDRQTSGAITADKFAVFHNQLKDGTPITSEEERLLAVLQGPNADHIKATFLEGMREVTAGYYKVEIGKAIQARDTYVTGAATVISKLKDKHILTSDRERLNRDHVTAQAEMLKYNAQIMALTEQAKNADAEYAALLTPGITLSNDDK